MNIAGIIVEYNPFHNGHVYHIEKTREITNADAVVAVMSGNFVQRGEPALLDKFSRAEAAVKSGADLVVELPSLFAVQSAELFAKGSVSLLNSLGCINYICFGSEAGSTELLIPAAKVLYSEPEYFKERLSYYMEKGNLFASARINALCDYIKKYDNDLAEKFSSDDILSILSSSNNILGLEYIKALMNLNSHIKPFTIERIVSDYNSEDLSGKISSATSIRNALNNINQNNALISDEIRDAVPENMYSILKRQMENKFYPVYKDDFFDALISIIIRDYEKLDEIFEISEGIENRIFKAALKAKDYSELEEGIKSKRYTMTRVKRCLNNILLGITKDDIQKAKEAKSIPYVRILAFNDIGRRVIKEIKNSSDIKIINKFSEVEHHLDDDSFRLFIKNDIRCTDIYNTVYYKNRRELVKGSMDYYIKPYYNR